MSPQEDLALLYRIAQNYYLHDYSQNDISLMENISRPQISRLLKRAREVGIVDIQVTLPTTPTRQELELRLVNRFGLEKVVIAPSSEDERKNDLSVYFTAATYLGEALPQFKNIGIGWGKTIYYTALNMAYQGDHQEMTFYSAVGNSGTNNPYLQTNSITNRFAENYHAGVCYNNLLTLSKKNSLDEIALARLKELRQSWSTLDAVVFSIGGKIKTDKCYIDEMPPEIYTPWVREEVVGDILGNYFLSDSSLLQFPQEYTRISMNLAEIQATRYGICVAHGKLKVDAIKFALENKLVKVLITDENTAKLLLANIQPFSQCAPLHGF